MNFFMALPFGRAGCIAALKPSAASESVDQDPSVGEGLTLDTGDMARKVSLTLPPEPPREQSPSFVAETATPFADRQGHGAG
jgi:hypothetical protein